MKLMNLATSAIASLLSKRDYSVATCPSACFSICDEAQVLAEAVGYNYTALCSPGSAFMDGYASIQSCIAANTDSSTTDDFPELQQYVNYCNSGSGSQDTSSVTQVTSSVTQVTSSATQDTSSVTPETTQVPPTSTSSQTTYQASSASTVSSLGSLSSAESSISSVGSVLASAASYASSISMSEYAVTWCLYYSISHSSIAVNCTSCKEGDRLKCWLTNRSSSCHNCSLDYGHQYPSARCGDLSSTEWSHLFPAWWSGFYTRKSHRCHCRWSGGRGGRTVLHCSRGGSLLEAAQEAGTKRSYGYSYRKGTASC
ncbi:hypothetical protein EDD37DRAFT_83051 [Exophiala viscosa]|uniref:uncharacterized protein n=1 Tax=Exophiala viscosa TaxID=2486360 RepID=UPI00219E5EA3|nr:hypothetical protein EDD37DRAFT_83051 [Exophiala viscosa]